MKKANFSPLSIPLLLVILVSFFAGVYQVVSARSSVDPVPLTQNSEWSASEADLANSTGVAGLAQPGGIMGFVNSTSPSVRVIIGTFSVGLGLYIYGSLIKKHKTEEAQPEEGE